MTGAHPDPAGYRHTTQADLDELWGDGETFADFDPDRPETYSCATGGDCGCVGTGLIGCPGRADRGTGE
jgi:hypothetical protein